MKHHGIQSLFAVTEVELVYRNKVKPADRRQVKSPSEIYDLMLAAWDMNKIELVEQMHLLLLDRGNYCLGISNIATGGISACLVDPKIVFATALKAKASSIVLAHNHPSGSLKPSDADIQMTKKFREAGKFLDLPLLDHLIITPRGFYSFAEEGLCS